ncbi:MAG: hypothetical protein KDK70_27220 [Myxococcales bacterium]|nr:hypothetical protein [Myxococcales bacterium]
MPQTMDLSDPVFHENIVILSGHGCLAETPNINTTIRVPFMFTVTLWTWTKGTGVAPSLMMLDDDLGNLIDSGDFATAYHWVNDKQYVNGKHLPYTYCAGEVMPNLMILPPRRNNTGTPNEEHQLYTVERPGSLEDFLANMQRENRPLNIHWSACSEIVTRRSPFGRTVNDYTIENLFSVAETYYWPRAG